MDEKLITEVSQDTQPKSTEQNGQKKRGHKKLFITLGILGIIILIPVLLAGWFGFVPGISTLMGAGKAKDLGVRYTAADFTSYQQKTGVVFNDFANAPANPNKPGKFIVFADPKTVQDISVTQSELTAAINNANWLWMPLTNTQVRLGDGTVEVSGNLNIDYITNFIGFIGGVSYNQADVQKAVDLGKKLVGNAPVYIKANASVTNNQVTLNLTEAKIGRYNVPLDIANKVLSSGTNNAIKNTAGLNAVSAQPKSGALVFTGTYPTTVYVKKINLFCPKT